MGNIPGSPQQRREYELLVEVMESELRKQNSEVQQFEKDTEKAVKELRERIEREEGYNECAEERWHSRRRAALKNIEQRKEEIVGETAALEEKFDLELEELKTELELEKRRKAQRFEQEEKELKEQHKADMDKVRMEMKRNKAKVQESINKAKNEREEVLKKQAKSEKDHKATLERASRNYEKCIEKSSNKLEEQVKKRTKIALEQESNEIERKIEGIQESYQDVQNDAIKSIHEKIFEQYEALQNKAQRMVEAAELLLFMIDNTSDPQELINANSGHSTQLELVQKQMKELKSHMNTCLSVSVQFKEEIMEPLLILNKTCNDTHIATFKVIMSVVRKSQSMSDAARDLLEKHIKTTKALLRDMSGFEVKKHVIEAQKKSQRFRITQ